MKFHEVHDPRGLCKDVSDLGRWGNGDVEVGLSRLDDLPYVMGLVRQAFEKQMGNGRPRHDREAEAYPAYKDSGVEWLGRCPRIGRVRHRNILTE